MMVFLNPDLTAFDRSGTQVLFMVIVLKRQALLVLILLRDR